MNNTSYQITVEDCLNLTASSDIEDIFFYMSLFVNFILLLTTLGSELTAASRCKANSLIELFCGKCKEDVEEIDKEIELEDLENKIQVKINELESLRIEFAEKN